MNVRVFRTKKRIEFDPLYYERFLGSTPYPPKRLSNPNSATTEVSPVFGNSLAVVVGGNFLAVSAEVSVVVACELVFELADCSVVPLDTTDSLEVVTPFDGAVDVVPFDDTCVLGATPFDGACVLDVTPFVVVFGV